MLFEIGRYKIDVDVDKTKLFYENTAEFVGKSCSCDGCINFETAVDTLSPVIKEFFASLGIDMKKVCECYVNYTDEEGMLCYGGFYHVCGTLLGGKSEMVEINEKTFCTSFGPCYEVFRDFDVSFHNDISLLEQEFPLPVIQLEFFAKLPWTLKKTNEYR